jgi:hypothetical protein
VLKYTSLDNAFERLTSMGNCNLTVFPGTVSQVMRTGTVLVRLYLMRGNPTGKSSIQLNCGTKKSHIIKIIHTATNTRFLTSKYIQN